MLKKVLSLFQNSILRKEPKNKVNIEENYLIGLGAEEGGPYSLNFVGLNLKFHKNSKWKISFEDLTTQQDGKLATVVVIYWGKNGFFFLGDSLLISPSFPVLPPSWTLRGHAKFSFLFKEVVFTYLLVLERLKFSSKILTRPLEYLCDFTPFAGSTNSCKFGVEPTSNYPNYCLRLNIGEHVHHLNEQKYGFGTYSRLMPCNHSAEISLNITQPIVERSDT